jgi:prepilin-type N-terminal cleavage/methylation domain-containing protein
MSQLTPHSASRRGVTLVELLVVVTIIVMLAAMAIPAMRPMSEERRIREAARAVNVYFGNARNRAVESGRAHGVMCERLARQPQACVVLRQAEVPPPYGGDALGTVAIAQDWTYVDAAGTPYWSSGCLWASGSTIVKLRIAEGSLSPGLIRYGDFIQLNHQGPWYGILPDDVNNGATDFPEVNGYINFLAGVDSVGNDGWVDNYALTLVVDSTQAYRSPYPERRFGALIWSNPIAFQILRQPVPSAVDPLQLSRGTVVDLGASGNDSTPAAFAPASAADLSAVAVLFSPDGGVDRVVVHGQQYRVTEPIYLLVGKWERVPAQPGGDAEADDGLHNWEDATNLWVAINPQTGLVTVAELHADVDDTTLNLSRPSDVSTARRFAREAQISKGGR